mmetsp:Transcript_22742/g.77390  ORF Transcript_22742/g.77390 Transcript_22742/m.77390 type:complete len:408 (+) Transcript_22742:82-1305(+)|eukprot:CAMPEP_0183800382 /NCGR_PEP_ID=MMETSP0803_2-20130417/24716_1 /TAXON_ID=195967 /ORGANISM="Crustomastix stigmata, Strain CCMP3273" /LENGTH=407 /DNA_ID=CAMNT_0026045095 /DNA_START=62 /DNA_END=1285 /DNA_ORIENTATION=+
MAEAGAADASKRLSRPSLFNEEKPKSKASVWYDTVSASKEDVKKHNMFAWIRFTIISVLMLVVILTLADVIPLMDTIGEDVVDGIKDMKVGGGFVYNFICIGMVIIWTPNSLLALAAGYIYESTGSPVLYGFLASYWGIVIGSIASFALARVLFQEWIKNEMRHRINVQQLNKECKDHGFLIVFLGRVSPIPSGLLNYAFAITEISYLQFTIATMLGLLPIVCAYAKVGSELYDFFETDELQDAVEACGTRGAPADCCALGASVASAYEASSEATQCSVYEALNSAGVAASCASFDSHWDHIATCLEDKASECSFKTINKEADDLSCNTEATTCLIDGDHNTCLKDLNSKEKWPLIVLPLALFFTVLIAGFFSHRALQRAGLLQVTYNLERHQELLEAELAAEAGQA